MKKFIESHKRLVSIIVFSFLAVLAILSFATRKNVSIDKAYYSKEDVAMYLIKYHELPENYYYKSPSDGRTYSNDVYGGFIHLYQDELPTKLKDSSFKECDIYYDGYSTSGARGTRRLVYTCNTKNVRVFYTEDHYKTFTELTEFNINVISHVFSILFHTFAVCSIVGYCIINKRSKGKELAVIN